MNFGGAKLYPYLFLITLQCSKIQISSYDEIRFSPSPHGFWGFWKWLLLLLPLGDYRWIIRLTHEPIKPTLDTSILLEPFRKHKKNIVWKNWSESFEPLPSSGWIKPICIPLILFPHAGCWHSCGPPPPQHSTLVDFLSLWNFKNLILYILHLPRSFVAQCGRGRHRCRLQIRCLILVCLFNLFPTLLSLSYR